jgi:hypothetical protein
MNAELDTLMNNVMSILGDGAAGFQEIAGAVQHAREEIDGAYNAIHMIESALSDAAARHSG